MSESKGKKYLPQNYEQYLQQKKKQISKFPSNMQSLNNNPPPKMNQNFVEIKSMK